jgi:hypothetical protein
VRDYVSSEERVTNATHRKSFARSNVELQFRPKPAVHLRA